MLHGPIKKLAEIQNKEGLSDGKMAKRLGCSRQLWQMTRSGETPLGMTVLKCILRRFPELVQTTLIFLSGDADGLTD